MQKALQGAFTEGASIEEFAFIKEFSLKVYYGAFNNVFIYYKTFTEAFLKQKQKKYYLLNIIP